VKELLVNVGSGGGGPGPAIVAGGAAGAGPTAEAEKEEEKKEEEKEESDEDMVCPLSFVPSDFPLTAYLFRASVFSINLLQVSIPQSEIWCASLSHHNFWTTGAK
jgi:hypothetical protein